jgi:class 3 adenylate cyclase/tetratricopeptide (TPR) repeat protein
MAIFCHECSGYSEQFARRCAGCGRTLPRVCPACGAGNEVTASFCSRCGVRVDDEALSRARERAVQAEGYLPKDLVDRFLAPGADQEGDQRQVTILFVDLAQSTEIVRALGGEKMADLLDELLDGIAGAVNHVGGTVSEISGDGALCLFGAPTVHEDDPERALRAALAIQRLASILSPLRVADADWQPRVRIGVHTGIVVLRVIGHAYRLGYAPVGDAVHLTQRFQTAAEPGEILVSKSTRDRAASLFRFGEPRALTLKGFAEPCVAFPLRGERHAPERQTGQAGDAVFVGREADLAAVRSRINSLAVGLGGILTIWGEAGIGKSRLLAEVRRQSSDPMTWLEGRGLSYGQNTPYSIIAQQLRRAAGIEEGDTERTARHRLRDMIVDACGLDEAPTVYPFLATAMGMKLEDREEALIKQFSSEALQTEIFRALRMLVGATTDRTPLVLIFEDLHWSDRASIAALDSLLPLADDRPILYVLVARPDTEAPSWTLRHKVETMYPHAHTSVNLGPLSEEASSTLVMRLLDTDHLATELREMFRDKAEGVPLFVEELTRSLLEEGALTREDGRWQLTVTSADLRIPGTVQGIILARFDRLERELKTILHAAAVIGPAISHRVLAHMTGENGALATRLRDLQRLGFLRETRRRPESVYVFKHALIRDVAYQTMRHRSRRELHGKAGTAMETVFGERVLEHQGVMAEHFLLAEDWEKATAYLLRAGDESTRLHAHAEARLHYAKAADALAHLPRTLEDRRRRVDTIVKRAAVSYIAEPPELNLGRLDTGDALVGELLAGEGNANEDRVRLAWIHYWTGRIHYIRGNPSEAMEYYERTLTAAQELGDRRLILVASAMMGTAFATLGQWGNAEKFLGQAVPILEQAGEWREWCLASGYLGVAIAAGGDYERGLAVMRQGLDRAVELGGWNLIASTRTLLCAVYLVNERMHELAVAAREAIEASERSGEQVILCVGLGFRSWAEGRLGDHASALAGMERSRKIATGLGKVLLGDWFAVARADVALCAGQVGTAVALAEEAVTAAKQTDDVFSGGLAHRVWARALAVAVPPQYGAAQAHLATSLELLESGRARLQAAHTHMVWGDICRDLGDFPAAIGHFGAALRQFTESLLEEESERAESSIRFCETLNRSGPGPGFPRPDRDRGGGPEPSSVPDRAARHDDQSG